MLRSWRAVIARFVALLARTPPGSERACRAPDLLGRRLLAGLTLGSITHTLDALPGLLVLVPAAIGMRGNVFGALGSRLGTAIHAGTFRLSRRLDTLVGQNLAGVDLVAVDLLLLAVLAKVMSSASGSGTRSRSSTSS